MTREKIISLARECYPKYMDSYGFSLVGVAAVEAFYLAVRNQAFEAAATWVESDQGCTHSDDLANEIREMAKENV